MIQDNLCKMKIRKNLMIYLLFKIQNQIKILN